MRRQLRTTVVLVGMMGAGKTAVGSALAATLGVPFADSDHEIELAANRTIPEVFARDGEAFFRDRERQVIARLLAGPPGVLATGGGAWLTAANRAVIGASAVSVWLRVDRVMLWSRVRQRETRPLLRTADPRATLEALCDARDPIYALADVTVDAERGLSVAAMAERVASALRQHGAVVPA